MQTITKKRRNAFLIDLVFSSVVNVGVKILLRKKIKNEAIHALVTPTAVFWSIEFLQLRKNGQTIGYKASGLKLEKVEGDELTAAQLIKRMAYRDFISTGHYLFNKQSFEGENGSILPHDRFAGTVVKEIRK